eukprot:TRINITY_DN1018_c0_g5_i2.p1 TRINITY_DN1018_c0_g5~~TRINITY_DN1018_c0_g5_i2.p1  ORF type:complete len:129 (+),score=18.69 TRINITY_DN1018_c0_g5_i2:33-419(+)
MSSRDFLQQPGAHGSNNIAQTFIRSSIGVPALVGPPARYDQEIINHEEICSVRTLPDSPRVPKSATISQRWKLLKSSSSLLSTKERFLLSFVVGNAVPKPEFPQGSRKEVTTAEGDPLAFDDVISFKM